MTVPAAAASAVITDQRALDDFCTSLKTADFITVDTEFLRDTTYWPKLCLVQVAGPDAVAAIDPLAPGIDLAPLHALLADATLLKVFHAARQDLEIFFHETGRVPEPIFDSQVAAMVCGFGESVGYEALVSRLARQRIDKASRFSDWSRRPLSDQQIAYALSDVTHLRTVYERLSEMLAENGRSDWLADEMAVLTDPGTYRLDPEEAWRRIKVRSDKPRVLAVLRAVAAWRETEAQRRDQPRSRVLKDEVLADIALQQPTSSQALARMRGLPGGFADSRHGAAVLEAVRAAKGLDDADLPDKPERRETPAGLGPVTDLLKVLLKLKCEEAGVAAKLVASSADLERIAIDPGADWPQMTGWRAEVFGNHARAMLNGEIGLSVDHGRIKLLSRT